MEPVSSSVGRMEDPGRRKAPVLPRKGGPSIQVATIPRVLKREKEAKNNKNERPPRVAVDFG